MLVKPVFILCLHRSGSTLLKNILDRNSQLAMATDEMHISDPLSRTLDNYLKKFDLQQGEQIDRFLASVLSGKIRGTFWTDYGELPIARHRLRKEIQKSEGTLQDIVNVFLEGYRRLRQKPRVGVKYPLHVSRIKMLSTWFPDARIVFLHRDIRAVIASKVNDEATRSRKRKLGPLGFLVHYLTVLYFIMDYRRFCRVCKGWAGKPNVCQIEFERMVRNPVPELTRLCEFLEIPFEESMLDAAGKPSSHGGKTRRGMDPGCIDRWKDVLSSFDRGLINVLAGKGRK